MSKCDCGATPDNRWPHHDYCGLYSTSVSKPESVKPQAKRCHPWRKWVDNPSDKQKSWYDPKNRVPYQDRMGLK